MDLQLQRSFLLAGITHQENRKITCESGIGLETPTALPAAKVGALTTRTDANTGELTMASGHGILTGQLLDVYWDGGCRRGMTVGTVADLAVPIDGGTGDDLPADETDITAMVPTVYGFHLIGDDLVAIVASAPAKAIISIQEADGTERHALIIQTANSTASWIEEDGATNPLATRETEKVAISHGDSSAARSVKISAGY